MGIDALDLVLRLESRLGIAIRQPEAIATFFDTVGTIHRYLVAKLNGQYRSVPKIQPLAITRNGVRTILAHIRRITGRRIAHDSTTL